jgi:hypothetical protein
MSLLNIIIFLYVLSFLDLTLTFYQFSLVNRKIRDYKKVITLEKNPVIRFIVRKCKGFNDKAYVISGTYVFTMFYLILIMSKFSIFVIGFFIGALVLVNLFHISNILMYRKNIDNEYYWDAVKLFRGWKKKKNESRNN